MKKLNKEDYKICIVGLGYVGLPLAARFSLKEFNVTGFDIKEERINELVKEISERDGVTIINNGTGTPSPDNLYLMDVDPNYGDVSNIKFYNE